MNMTMTQKILAAHAEKDAVRPGELVMARLDLVLGNDITAPVAIGEFQKFGRAAVFDREKIALVPDHFTPNKDIKAAAQCAARIFCDIVIFIFRPPACGSPPRAGRGWSLRSRPWKRRVRGTCPLSRISSRALRRGRRAAR